MLRRLTLEPNFDSLGLCCDLAANGYNVDDDLYYTLLKSIITRNKTPIHCDIIYHPVSNILIYINLDDYHFGARSKKVALVMPMRLLLLCT